MVVKQDIRLDDLDLGHLGLFVGLRFNELVLESAARAGFAGLRESHGYVIQHFVEADRSVTELATRMQVTQQAASKAVAELVRIGLLEASQADDRRSKRISLSARGRGLVRIARRRRKEIEKRLIAKVGIERYRAAQAVLVQSLETLGTAERIRRRRVRAPQ